MKKMCCLLVIVLLACNRNRNKIRGTWLIDKVYYNNNLAVYDLLTNSIHFNSGGNCTLPAVDDNDQQQLIGDWDVYDSHGQTFLKIVTKNKMFNRSFFIADIRDVRDSVSGGMLTKMTLACDSIKMMCTKVPY